jgi:hypothetical protein
MRAPILSAFAAAALFALAPAAHARVTDPDDGVADRRECPLPAPLAHNLPRLEAGCQATVVTPPAEERVLRVRRQAAGERGADFGRRDIDAGAALVEHAVYSEAEDRQGWDDHEYAQRDGGLRQDSGDGRSGLYREALGRAFLPGEHWIGPCGCGPASPTAIDQ